ncbi:MAG: cation:dicarboxylase symporter family transporter [Coriobacteriales bacterium]|nr:cation:dicarboxylase symporter family transporter [Coriobacteriales bacterium]
MLVSLWVALLTIVVALFFFPVWGSVNTSIDITEVEGVLLGVLPTNLIAPFAEGQIPQVILLGIVFGIALLMMGDSGKPIREALAKVKEWAMSVMMLIMKILPLLPFISTMTIVANGESTAFLQGWKYIAAAYICYLLTIAIEFVAVSVRCKRSVSDLLGMLKQIAVMAFVTATPALTMQMTYETSEKDMGIDASFTDLWLSLSFNLLSPARTISLVLSVFFIADMSGMTVDFAVLLIMLIMVVQMSLASSGTVPSATVILKTIKLPADAVGLFGAFEIFTRNAAAAYDVTYSRSNGFFRNRLFLGEPLFHGLPVHSRR